MATFRVVHRLGTFDVEAAAACVEDGFVVLEDAGECAVALFPADGTAAVVRVDAMAAALPAAEAVAGAMPAGKGRTPPKGGSGTAPPKARPVPMPANPG